MLLKTATFAVAAILIGAVVLLVATSNGTKEVADKSPAVPEISSSDDDSAPSTSTSPSAPVLAPPPVYSETAQVVPVRPAPTTPTQPVPPPTTPSDDDEPQFAVIGQPCQPEGSFSFTVEYEPVVCSNGRGDGRPTWHRMF